MNQYDVVYSIEPLREHADYRNEMDGEDIAWIRRELDDGNEWAWCTACVTAQLVINGWVSDYSGCDSLGACSYESEGQFLSPGGYAPDMRRAAYDDMVKKLPSSIRAEFLQGVAA